MLWQQREVQTQIAAATIHWVIHARVDHMAPGEDCCPRRGAHRLHVYTDQGQGERWRASQGWEVSICWVRTVRAEHRAVVRELLQVRRGNLRATVHGHVTETKVVPAAVKPGQQQCQQHRSQQCAGTMPTTCSMQRESRELRRELRREQQRGGAEAGEGSHASMNSTCGCFGAGAETTALMMTSDRAIMAYSRAQLA